MIPLFACRFRAAGRSSLGESSFANPVAWKQLKSWVLAIWIAVVGLAIARAGETFRVATYNLEGYLDAPTETRSVKSAAGKAKIRESILVLKPDVIALQEIGTVTALTELRESLEKDGLSFPHWEHVSGRDTNIHVAVLSRFPITARHSHTNESFLLSGRRHYVSRGIAEVEIQVAPNYSFALLTAHLKSKRAVPQADESELRFEEAKVLREKIDARLLQNPGANLLVLGDLNDTKDAVSTKAVIGKGRGKLVDTRPAERNGDDAPNANPAWEPRNVTWTHYFGKTDAYDRIDYILASPGLARNWVTNETFVLALPNWGLASDHRPLVATFRADDQ